MWLRAPHPPTNTKPASYRSAELVLSYHGTVVSTSNTAPRFALCRRVSRAVRPPGLGPTTIGLTLACAVAPSVRADMARQCRETLGASRAAEHRGRLLQARHGFDRCAVPACPSKVRTECIRSRQSLSREIPAVRVQARDPRGHETRAVRVYADGLQIAEVLSARALEFDPGSYSLRFEHDGAAPVDQTFQLDRGDAPRVHIEFEAAPQFGASQEVLLRTRSQRDADMRAGRGRRPSPQGDGTRWTWTPLAPAATREASCAQNCSVEELDSLRSKLRAADLSLGVGIAGVPTGVSLFFLSRPKAERAERGLAAWSFTLEPDRTGGYGRVRGKF